jgi:hypothetical protein
VRLEGYNANMGRIAWIAGAVLLLGALSWFALLQGPPPTDDAPAEPARPGDAQPAPVANAAPQTPAQPQPPSQRPATEQTPAPATRAAEASPATPPPGPLPAPKPEGPITELKQRFKTEPRQSSASEFEAAIQREFAMPNIPAGLLKSAQCRTSVCRIELRWRADRAEGYMGALMRSYLALNMKSLATEPLGELDTDGSSRVDVYFGSPSPLGAPTP